MFVVTKVAASGDVSDAHGMEPIDKSTSPFGTGQFQPPQRASL
jgi:hypothetical protein